MVTSVKSLYASLNLAKAAKYKLFDHLLTLLFSHHKGIEYSLRIIKRGTMSENLKISFLMKIKTVNLKKLISIRTDIHV